jgi:hypothetical protein
MLLPVGSGSCTGVRFGDGAGRLNASAAQIDYYLNSPDATMKGTSGEHTCIQERSSERATGDPAAFGT